MLMQPLKTLSSLVVFICILVTNGYSQAPVKTYEKEWKKVEAFAKKNLPKSAFTEVKKIYDLAKKEKQDAQVIKALIYMTGLQSENRENNEMLSIREIESEIINSKQPVASVLKNILAELYWNYFQQHRYQLYNRTKTYNYQKYDIGSWDTEDFHKKIGELYLQSTQNEKLLQQTKLEPFDAIIVKGNTRNLRPTLYDLLAHRALEYFSIDERDIKKPAYAFEIDQASAFDPAADFITRKFLTNDSLSLKHKALMTYQKLLAFHINDAKPDALIDADIKRVEYVYLNSVHPDKDRLYFNAINHLANQYGDHPAAAQAWYLLAAYYNVKATDYKPYGDSAERFTRIKVKEICERVLKQKVQSEGWVNCYNLLNSITQVRFSFNIEKVNIPAQPFRALVNYYNMSTIYFRIIQPTETLKKEIETKSGDEYWKLITAAIPLRSWEQLLPDTKDLQEHKAEIKVDGLPAGEYMLVAANDKDFKDKNTLVGARGFYVSNISYVNSGEDHFVLNRDNGKPLAKASVQVWEQRYDYKAYKYTLEKGKLYQTDEHGFFKKEKTKDDNNRYRNESYKLEISFNGEKLFIKDFLNDYYYYRDNNNDETGDITSVFLFTDRSIYRPAQTLYYKGIAVTSNSRKKTGSVNSNYETWLYLRDANYQKIDSIKVKANEYGSFSGKFQLPSGGLNGQFSIYIKEDITPATFRVEEYKRPKFFVEYEKLKGTYKVNDKIKVTGVAKAYAGNNIDGATVKYRVVREARFLYPWLFRRWWQPPGESLEITHGETKTDKDGKFVVEFTAIPDLKIQKKFEPVFDYRVYADITDINGETRSGELSVSVSYKSLLLKTVIPSSLPADSLRLIFIRTENMNGEFEPAIVKVTITGLKEEKRLIRSRYWERPDQFVMGKEEYIKHFPYDEYDNETDHISWEKENKVFERADSVKSDGKWAIMNGQFAPGWYMIEITTKDKDGEDIKDVQYIELIDEKSNQLTFPKYLWTQTKPGPIEPGEKDIVKLGTSADNLFIVQQLDKTGITYSFTNLNNEKKNFEFTTTEADRGGYGVSWMFVKHNRVYQLGHKVNVSWANKDLTVEYATFRDKTLPGSEEKWKVKISGYKKEKVAAEILASMYDASLDQFYPHRWFRPSVWPYYSNLKSWNGTQNFSKLESNQKYIAIKEGKTFDKRYDELLAYYVFSPYYRNSAEPLWWVNPLNYAYSEFRNPRLMRLSKKEGARGEEVMEQMAAPSMQVGNVSFQRDMSADVGNDYLDSNADGVADKFDKEKTDTPPDQIQIRKNFNETAFFFPDLRTNENGDIEFSFTIPEALTRWKFQALTHTKELAFGYSSKEIVTQKQLMVQPNAPRFLREGDRMEFSAKIVNLTDKEFTGQAELQLFDAATNESVGGWFNNMYPNQYFTVAAGQSEAVVFPIQVPYLFDKALVWRIVARAGNVSDGEEAAMPVLTNRMLVTETLPLNLRDQPAKNFRFEKLLTSGNSETLRHHSLTVEYTSNPAWYAVQALPYLMEFPYECSEQTWNRYYANALASKIANASPRIKQIFESWNTKDTAALLSNLQKNQELKAVLLEETPWVLQAKTEEQQKKNITLLFDMIRMSSEMNSSYEKLKQMQSENGGFVWFKGGPDNRYITQYIVTGIGHLKKLGVDIKKLEPILKLAIPYLDLQIKKQYDELKKNKTDLSKYTPGYYEIQYLYMRSFFAEQKIPAASHTAYNYFRSRTQLTWTKQSKYMQGMIALSLFRTADAKTPSAILRSLKETSINNEELGMYWKENSGGWFWHQAPVETQALLIEAFSEISKDTKTIDDLKTWLLKNKQTTNWKTTKATAEACYALLLQGTDLLINESVVEIKLGNTAVTSTDNKEEAGTGYFKRSIAGPLVTPNMGNISVSVQPIKNQTISTTWGGVYWQYFEDLDKITTASTPLKLDKKLFVETNTDRGPVLTPVNEGDIVKVGDKIKVRIELRVDRDMEYVHMKDMRASCLEPVNVLSSYKWQGGLGYYETTKDASTSFFFDYLRKGTYVFEYTLFVTHTGNFSNGITNIQCMYAPEFSSHSEGIRLSVE
ncbi:MAG TPA: alpha-2-macroglobulin family protein [Chitinophagaceae bacterium]